MKKNRIQGMARSIDQWRNMVSRAVALGSQAQVEYALKDAKHDIDVLWRKVASQAAELAAVKEMYAREGAKALYELERAERAEARLAEALKALDAIERYGRAGDE